MLVDRIVLNFLNKLFKSELSLKSADDIIAISFCDSAYIFVKVVFDIFEFLIKINSGDL